MKLLLQKKCKICDRWELRPQTPVPPAAGDFAPRTPASGSWGLRPQTPKTAPPLRISGYAPALPGFRVQRGRLQQQDILNFKPGPTAFAASSNI